MMPASGNPTLLAAVLVASLASTPPVAADPIVRLEEVDASAHPRIRARLTIATRDHVPLTGLGIERFRIFEKPGEDAGRDPGRVRALTPTSLATAEDLGTPLAVAFVIQHSGSWAPALAETRAAIAAFLRRLKPADRAAIVSYSDDARVLATLDEKDVATAALTELANPGLEKRFLAGLEAAFALFVETGGPAIRALVVLGDGGDSGSTAQADALLATARTRGIPVHTVGFSRLGDDGFRLLRELSATSGGSFQHADSPHRFEYALERIRQSLVKQYVLEWSARELPADGGSHRVAVEATLGGSAIRLEALATTPHHPSRLPWMVGGVMGLLLVTGAVVLVLKNRPKPLRQCGHCKREQLPEWPTCPFCLRSAAARLRVIAGAGEGSEFPLVDGVHEVGKGLENAIRLNDAAISTRHCALVVEAGRIEVLDRGSANGTFVNGVRVKRRALRHGDRLRLGRTELMLGISGDAESKPDTPTG